MTVGVLDNRVVRAANLERSLAGADMQPGLAMQLALQNQLADQFQFSLRSVRAHSSSRVMIPVRQSSFVVRHNGLEQVPEAFIAAAVILARDLQQELLHLI